MTTKLTEPSDIGDIDPRLRIFRSGLPAKELKGNDAVSNTRMLKQEGYLATRDVIFIVHGFLDNIDTEWLGTMKDAILEINTGATIILVGWGKGCNHLLEYPLAAANTQSVGKWLAPYATEIRKLCIQGILIWGIGHSLGAHVLGIAGRNSGYIPSYSRITGLDPAGPSFERVNTENRLKSTDAAEMVDVIHTDGYESPYDPLDWFSPVNHYGTLIPLGTLDFYPNGGCKQPGVGEFTIAGSHHRAIDLFAWSIKNPGKFKTNLQLVKSPEFEKPVTDTKVTEISTEMGYYAFQEGKQQTGNYYLKTNAEIPWVPVKP